MKQKKKYEKEMEDLRRELREYRRQGIGLYLDGKSSTPKEIARACVIAENGTYMRDYGDNEGGEIRSINFEFVENE